jgi:hypothetical protein
MILTDQLLTVARSYCQARGLSLARVSTLVFNEGKKLEAIASRGADLATGRFENAMRWFSSNWPEGCDWPSDVPRPATSNEHLMHSEQVIS